jgi:hypothetical protein
MEPFIIALLIAALLAGLLFGVPWYDATTWMAMTAPAEREPGHTANNLPT